MKVSSPVAIPVRTAGQLRHVIELDICGHERAQDLDRGSDR